MIKPLQFFFPLAFAALTAACGGGSGGGFGGLTAADATAVIDTNNAINIIRSVDDSSAIAEDLVLGTIVGAAAVSSAAAASAVNSADSLRVVPTAQSTEFCNGGTADPQEPDDFTLSISFEGCQDFMYTSDKFAEPLEIMGLVNGIIRIEVSLSSTDESDFQATVVLTDFSIDDTWGDGTLTLDYMETTSLLMVEITTSAFDIRHGAATRSLEAYSFLFIDDSSNQPEETEESRGGVTSSDFAELAFFETPQPFGTNASDLWPSSGRRIIYGADQARIRVTPLGNGLEARIELDLDGVEGFEQSCRYTWEELLGDTDIIACEGV